MSSGVPIFWILVAFNFLFIGVYLYLRVRDSAPLPAPLTYLAQGLFVAVNCLFFFQEDAQRYVNWLTGVY